MFDVILRVIVVNYNFGVIGVWDRMEYLGCIVRIIVVYCVCFVFVCFFWYI